MKKTLLIAAIFGLFATVSCKKNNADSTVDPAVAAKTLNDVKVPNGFTWESSRSLNVNVTNSDSRFGTAAHTIAVYDGDPNSGGHLLTQGAASTTTAFATQIYLPSLITQLYVVKTAPDKSTITQKVAAGTAPVSLAMGAVDPAYVVNSIKSSAQVMANPASPDCSGGTAITASRSDLDMNSGDTYSITGSNITVGLRNINGGTIKVCGTNVTISGNLSGDAKLIITSSGSVTFTGNQNNNNNSITNFGTLTIPGNRADAGSFYNYGVCTINGDCNMNGSNAVFNNGGTLTITGGWQGGTSSTCTNSGTMVVYKNFQTNNTPFVNNCSLYVKQNYLQDNGTVQNYNLIKVDGTSTLNDNKELGLYNGAMLYTNNLIVNGKIIGYGSTSLVKITGTTAFQNSGSVISNVQVYAVKGIDASYSNRITAGATQDNSVYIATSGCNSEGNGTATVKDYDGDGVADNLDAYPNDATKAYNVTGATGTLAYEDQWPVKGDFDMNDVVMGYSYTLVTSSTNVVVSVNGTYTLYATGGGYANAFGVEFPVSKSLVSGLAVTKAGVPVVSPVFEGGQSKAVVVIFGNMRDEMATWNTKNISVEAFTAYKTYTVSFNITNGPTLSTFGQDAYNPFIYNSGRGHEVHLSGKTPTNLVDASLFGTNDDNSSVSAGRYYVTKTGLPYAINVPAVFAYPAERIDITNAYLHFADWAASGGSSYTDWYSSLATGYRLPVNIYTH